MAPAARERIAHQVRSGWRALRLRAGDDRPVECRIHYRSMHNIIDPALADKAVGYLRALLWGARDTFSFG